MIHYLLTLCFGLFKKTRNKLLPTPPAAPLDRRRGAPIVPPKLAPTLDPFAAAAVAGLAAEGGLGVVAGA
jgi:hypothetical protein